MRYIPNTPTDQQEMLKAIGLVSLDELFPALPTEKKLTADLILPSPLSESELFREMERIGQKNAGNDISRTFLGGGAYHHYIPSAIDHLISRSEFYTAYTPYQPEISQGTLQAIYEFQTLIAQLTGMEVTNASMYDGASALAESAIMAKRINQRSQLIVAAGIHPHYRKVLNTYTKNLNMEIKVAPYDSSGATDVNWLKDNISGQTSAILIQSPNFFGVIEPLNKIKELSNRTDSLLIVGITEPISLGILTPPGDFGADIVIGEGQSLGIPTSLGGPYLGFFATRKKYLRNMPGRLVGETVDQNGKRGFVLTLATREQHIRRSRATSNICSNEALCALSATIYMSLLGKKGLKKLARLNLSKAEYVKKNIGSLDNFKLKFTSPTFNEFVIESNLPPSEINKKLAADGIIGGIPLEEFYPELKNSMLFCVTETNQDADIDLLCQSLKNL